MAITRNQQLEYLPWQADEIKIINGLPVQFRDVCVHEFRVGDVEDPDIMAGEPLWTWQQSAAGSWIMEHAVEKPYWSRNMDLSTYSYVYRIVARLSEPNELFWRLKYVDTKN
jgi:hypothetical protein